MSKENTIVRFIENPNLPKGHVRLLLAGRSYIPRLDFSKWGVDVLPILPYNQLERPLVEHADMQVLHLYSNKIISNPSISCKVVSLYKKYIEKIDCKGKELAIDCCMGSQKDLSQYPNSAAYNVLILGKRAIYNPKCIDLSVLSHLKSLYTCISVRQGYARCTSCIVRENAVITADPGIAKTLRQLDVDVLDIVPGYIDLPGYKYGFIGGASFKISDNQLAFTGKLDCHPDAMRIFHFLEKYFVEPIFLSKESIFDMGSAIPLIEEFGE